MKLPPLAMKNQNVISRIVANLGVVLLLLFFIAHYLLIASGDMTYAKYLSAIFSPLLATATVRRVDRNQNESIRAGKNIQEAQKLISEKTYGLFRYAKGDYALGTEKYLSFRELIAEPVVWVLCLAVGSILYLNPGYLDFANEGGLKAKFAMISFLQLLLFSTFLSGVFFSIKHRGSK